MIRAEDISIEVRDNSLARRGQIDIDDIEKLQIFKRFCNVGTWDLTLPAESLGAQLLKQHLGITVTGKYKKTNLVSPESYPLTGETVKNLIPDPDTTGTGFWVTASATKAIVGGKLRATASGAAGMYVYSLPATPEATANRFTVTIGEMIGFRAEITNPGSSSLWIRLGLAWYNSAGSNLAGGILPPIQEIASGQTLTLDMTGLVPSNSGATTGCLPLLYVYGSQGGGNVPAGTNIDTTKWALYRGASEGAQIYFSGNTPDEPLADYSFTGSANFSSSLKSIKRFQAAVFEEVYEDFILLSGRVDEIQTEQDSDDLEGMTKFVGFDDNIHLADALAWPQPSNADPNTQNVSHDVRTGSAEDLLRQYMSFNIGPGSTVDRRISGLALEASSLGRGATVTARARFDQLGLVMSQVALEGGLGFDLQQSFTTDTIVLRIFEPADKSSSVIMSIENDDLKSAKFGVKAPRATRAIVAGQGEGTDRVVIKRTTAEAAAAEALWGRKIEIFKDRRDTDQLAELEAEGDIIVTENGVTINSLSVVPSDDIPKVYGRDWFLGDIVGVTVAGQDLVAKVTEAAISIDADGLRIGATVGNPSGFDFEAQLISKQKDQETRLAHLEKNAELGDYAAASHTHAISGVTGLQTALDGKAALVHTHDDRYYTESEMNSLLDGKSDRTVATRAATAAPSTYPLGVSVMTVGTDSTWPSNLLTVTTSRVSSSRTSQTAVRKVTGQTWTRSEDDPDTWGPWFEVAAPGGARVYGNGLVKIKPSGGSGVTIGADGEIAINSASSWRIDDCFPPEFRFFKIFFQINTASQAGVTVRLASGVTVDSSANYDYGGVYNGGGGTGQGATADDQPHWIWDGGMSGHFHTGDILIRDPNFAGATFWTGSMTTRRTATPSLVSATARGGLHQVGAAYSGLWMAPTTGTASGIIDIYGCR